MPVNLWNKIVKNAWKSAEPGILFWDTIIKESVPDCYADLGLPHSFNKSMRRNSALPIRQLPFAGNQSIFVC